MRNPGRRIGRRVPAHAPILTALAEGHLDAVHGDVVHRCHPDAVASRVNQGRANLFATTGLARVLVLSSPCGLSSQRWPVCLVDVRRALILLAALLSVVSLRRIRYGERTHGGDQKDWRGRTRRGRSVVGPDVPGADGGPLTERRRGNIARMLAMSAWHRSAFYRVAVEGRGEHIVGCKASHPTWWPCRATSELGAWRVRCRPGGVSPRRCRRPVRPPRVRWAWPSGRTSRSVRGVAGPEQALDGVPHPLAGDAQPVHLQVTADPTDGSVNRCRAACLDTPNRLPIAVQEWPARRVAQTKRSSTWSAASPSSRCTCAAAPTASRASAPAARSSTIVMYRAASSTSSPIRQV